MMMMMIIIIIIIIIIITIIIIIVILWNVITQAYRNFNNSVSRLGINDLAVPL